MELDHVDNGDNMKTYGSISATRSTNIVQNIVAILSILIMIIITIGMWYHYFIIKSIPFILISSSVVLPSIFCFLRIMKYSKREVLNILSPNIFRKSNSSPFFTILKTFITHPIELVIIPTYIATVIYLYISLSEIAFYTGMTLIVAVIYAIQILPLMIKKEMNKRESQRALNYVRDEIKITRILLFDLTTSSEERERALQRHLAAEELMSIHSDYIIGSTNIIGTFIMVIRLIMPIFTGLGGQIIQTLLGG